MEAAEGGEVIGVREEGSEGSTGRGGRALLAGPGVGADRREQASATRIGLPNRKTGPRFPDSSTTNDVAGSNVSVAKDDRSEVNRI